ncbi:MAG: hypothetical protein H7145_03440 [Akkermansiaceae bacterium]|nr:hypothetical protein [Armatimonadota bacterium]
MTAPYSGDNARVRGAEDVHLPVVRHAAGRDLEAFERHARRGDGAVAAVGRGHERQPDVALGVGGAAERETVAVERARLVVRTARVRVAEQKTNPPVVLK